MSSALVIAGGMLQLLGLLLVFAEIAAIRAHEWGIVPPWTRLGLRLRRLLRLRRSVTAHVESAAGVVMFGGTARAEVRPSPLADDASQAGRIDWLERYVRPLNEDLGDVWKAINRERDAAVAEAKQSAEEIQRQIRASDQRRRSSYSALSSASLSEQSASRSAWCSERLAR